LEGNDPLRGKKELKQSKAQQHLEEKRQ